MTPPPDEDDDQLLSEAEIAGIGDIVESAPTDAGAPTRPGLGALISKGQRAGAGGNVGPDPGSAQGHERVGAF
jgi:hypothetical protein